MAKKVEETKLRTLKIHLKVDDRVVVETYKDVTKNLFFVEANGGKVYHIIETLTERIHIVECVGYNVLRVEGFDQIESNALTEVADEMKRQLSKWGEQNHPSYTNGDAVGGGVNADMAKLVCESKATHGRLSWNDIFLEEVFEARDEAIAGDLDKLRTELIQCAAVAVSWAESIDRNKK